MGFQSKPHPPDYILQGETNFYCVAFDTGNRNAGFRGDYHKGIPVKSPRQSVIKLSLTTAAINKTPIGS